MNDRERLWNYYAAGRFFLPRPRYLCVNATLRCDGHCLHCGIWRQPPLIREITPTELATILHAPLFSRVETAWLTGGEPTLRPDLADFAGAILRSLPSLQTLGIATNGLEPSRVVTAVDALASLLSAERHALFVHVSLDGVGEIHDRVRGRQGAFEAVVETLERLESRRKKSNLRLEIGLNCVIQPANFSGLFALHDFARQRGLPLMFNVVVVTDQVYRNLDRAEFLTLLPEQRRAVAAFLEFILPFSPPAFRYQSHIIQAVLCGRRRPRRCLTLYTTVNINADGTLIPCPASSDWFPRNLLTEEAGKVWRSLEARAMRARVSRELCPACMLSCSLGDSMPLSEWLRGGWDG